MTHVPFYLTRAGARFYEHTLPELVRQLKRLNDTLERLAKAAETQGESHDEEEQHDDGEEGT